MNENYTIRIATMDDLDNINILFRNAITDLHNVKKINVWNNVYPFCEFEYDIDNKEMYVIENDNKIIGSFTITKYDDPEYHVINWTSNNKKWFYINRLVILPTEQGKGFAKMAMNYINNYAVDNNYEVIRLTVNKDNIYAITLYEKFGFKKIANSQYSIKDKILWGFEKLL